MKKIWVINKWYGGIADGTRVGVTGSTNSMYNVNFRTNPDVLGVQQQTASDSGSIVSALPKWIVPTNSVSGSQVFTYDASGNIYLRTSGGSWSLDRAVSASNGQGMDFWNDYLFYTRNGTIGRKGPFVTGGGYTDSYQTLTNYTTNWGPMKLFLAMLCVGNGRLLATIDDSGTFTANKLTLPLDWNIKSLEVVGDFLAIGAFKGTNVYDYEEARLFFWDGVSDIYNSFIVLRESGINALLNINNILHVWAGLKGALYVYNGNSLTLLKRLKGIGIGEYIEMYPGAATGWKGLVHYGAAGAGDAATVLRGIYTWGSLNKNYPEVLSLDYTVSTGTTIGTTLQIGAVKAVGPTNLYIGYRDGTTYRVDKVSLTSTTPMTTSMYESLVFDGGDPYRVKFFNKLKITTKPLATGQSILIEVKLDQGSYATLGTFSYATDGAVRSKLFDFTSSGKIPNPRGSEIQIKMTITSTTTFPEINSIAVEYVPENDI